MLFRKFISFAHKLFDIHLIDSSKMICMFRTNWNHYLAESSMNWKWERDLILCNCLNNVLLRCVPSLWFCNGKSLNKCRRIPWIWNLIHSIYWNNHRTKKKLQRKLRHHPQDKLQNLFIDFNRQKTNEQLPCNRPLRWRKSKMYVNLRVWLSSLLLWLTFMRSEGPECALSNSNHPYKNSYRWKWPWGKSHHHLWNATHTHSRTFENITEYLHFYQELRCCRLFYSTSSNKMFWQIISAISWCVCFCSVRIRFQCYLIYVPL